MLGKVVFDEPDAEYSAESTTVRRTSVSRLVLPRRETVLPDRAAARSSEDGDRVLSTNLDSSDGISAARRLFRVTTISEAEASLIEKSSIESEDGAGKT